MERQVNSRTKFSGRLLKLREDRVQLSDGRQSTREVVDHPGAIGILPVTDTGAVLLVEHFRYAVGRTLLEIPAGTREAGESAVETARRELEEETGYRAGELRELGRFFTSPGWSTEEIVLYRAGRLSVSGHRVDHDEILNVVEVVPERIPVLMRDGMLADAKTIIAVQMLLANVE